MVSYNATLVLKPPNSSDAFTEKHEMPVNLDFTFSKWALGFMTGFKLCGPALTVRCLRTDRPFGNDLCCWTYILIIPILGTGKDRGMCWHHSPWNSPGQNTGVGSLFLLQGIFPTQGSNPGLLHCLEILYELSHQWSPGILEWVAYPFSSGSSWPRNQPGVSCIASRFSTSWATREA